MDSPGQVLLTGATGYIGGLSHRLVFSGRLREIARLADCKTKASQKE